MFQKITLIAAVTISLLYGCNIEQEPPAVDYTFISSPQEGYYFPTGIHNFYPIQNYNLLSYAFAEDIHKTIPLGHVLMCLDTNNQVVWRNKTMYEDGVSYSPYLERNDSIYAFKSENFGAKSKGEVKISVITGKMSELPAGAMEVDHPVLKDLIWGDFAFYEDSIFFRLKTYPTTYIDAYNWETLMWTDTLGEIESSPADLYLNETIPEPYLFLIAGKNMICMNMYSGKRVWAIDSLNIGSGSIVNYDPEQEILYLQHGFLYAINYKTGEIKFEVKDLYLGNSKNMSYHKIYSAKYIFAFNKDEIGIYNRFNGEFINRIKIPQPKDGQLNLNWKIVDLMVESEHLIVLTSSPTSLIKLPVEQLIKVKEMDINGDSIIFK